MKNNFYNLAGGILRIAVKLLTVPILIRALGLEGFGIWVLVTAIVESLLLVEKGFSFSSTVYVAQELPERRIQAIQETLSIVLVALCCLAILAVAGMVWVVPEISILFRKLTEAQYEVAVAAIKISSLVVAARMLQQVFVGVQQAALKYGTVNVTNTVQTVVLNGGVAVFALSGSAIPTLMVWGGIVSFSFLVVHLVLARRLLPDVPVQLRFNWAKAVEMMRFSIGAWGSALGSTCFSFFDKLVVGAILGPAWLAIYGFITSVCIQVNYVSSIAVQPMLPMMSRNAGKVSQHDELMNDIRQSVRINGLMACGASAFLIAAAAEIFYWLNPEAHDAQNITAFRWAALLYGMYSLNAVGYFVLYALKETIACMKIQVFSGLTAVCFIALGAHYYGLMGAVLGNYAYLLVWLLNVKAMRLCRIRFADWARWLVVPVGGGILCVAFSFALPDTAFSITLKLLLVAVVFGAYALFVWQNRTGRSKAC